MRNIKSFQLFYRLFFLSLVRSFCVIKSSPLYVPAITYGRMSDFSNVILYLFMITEQKQKLNNRSVFF